MSSLQSYLLASVAVLFAQCSHGQTAIEHDLKNGKAGAPQPVSTAQVDEMVGSARGESDDKATEEIGRLVLTERLSSSELAKLSGELPGDRSKATLIAVGDASAFLDHARSDVQDKAPPDAMEQQQIVSRARDYLQSMIPKLPDFYAKRITTAFKVAWTPQDKYGTHQPGPLKRLGKYEATVLYRHGKEVVNAEGSGQEGLITRGTFGPVLSAMMTDNLRRPMQWLRWEKGPDGPMAVFEFHVPKKDSHYGVSFWMARLPNAAPTGYHGEIGIDPATGTILSVALLSDPVVGVRAVEHVDILLEYGPVVIGGKTYTCPVRGVSISRARYQEPGIVRRDRAFILLDDVVFTDYHMFRADTRIVPDTDAR